MTWDDNIQRGMTALGNADYQTAEAEFSEALQHAKQGFGHTDKRIPETISFLAQALYRQKKFDEAEPLLKQAIKLNKALNASDFHKGVDIYSLSCIQQHKGDKASERNAREALLFLQRSLPATEVENLVSGLHQVIEHNGASGPSNPPVQEKPDPAKKTKNKPAQTKNDPSPAEPKEPISPIQRPEPTEQQYEDWVAKFNAALELVNGEDTAQIVAGYKQLNDLLIHIYKTFPLPHPCVAETANGMALAASYLELFERAKNLFHLAIHNMDATLGPQSVDAARIKLNLACLYRDQDESPTGTINADLYFRQSFDVFQQDPNMDRQWFNATAHAFSRMLERARVEIESYAELQKISNLEQQHKLEEACKASQDLYNKLKEYFPPSSQCYITLFKEQARILRKLGKGTEADVLLRGADDMEKNRLEKAALKNILESQLPPIPAPWNA